MQEAQRTAYRQGEYVFYKACEARVAKVKAGYDGSPNLYQLRWQGRLIDKVPEHELSLKMLEHDELMNQQIPEPRDSDDESFDSNADPKSVQPPIEEISTSTATSVGIASRERSLSSRKASTTDADGWTTVQKGSRSNSLALKERSNSSAKSPLQRSNSVTKRTISTYSSGTASHRGFRSGSQSNSWNRDKKTQSARGFGGSPSFRSLSLADQDPGSIRGSKRQGAEIVWNTGDSSIVYDHTRVKSRQTSRRATPANSRRGTGSGGRAGTFISASDPGKRKASGRSISLFSSLPGDRSRTPFTSRSTSLGTSGSSDGMADDFTEARAQRGMRKPTGKSKTVIRKDSKTSSQGSSPTSKKVVDLTAKTGVLDLSGSSGRLGGSPPLKDSLKEQEN